MYEPRDLDCTSCASTSLFMLRTFRWMASSRYLTANSSVTMRMRGPNLRRNRPGRARWMAVTAPCTRAD